VAALIAAQRDEHGVPAVVACRALGVSRSWSCKHEDGTLPPRQVRREQLKAEVRRLFAAHRGTYGPPRITAGLREAGWTVSENTVAAVMAELGLAARRKKKRKAATRPGKGRWRAPDLVKRDFPAGKINQEWYGDGTEIGTDEGAITASRSAMRMFGVDSLAGPVGAAGRRVEDEPAVGDLAGFEGGFVGVDHYLDAVARPGFAGCGRGVSGGCFADGQPLADLGVGQAARGG
jgi:hypothetical protein